MIGTGYNSVLERSHESASGNYRVLRTTGTGDETGLYTYSTLPDSWLLRTVKPVSYEIRICENLFDPNNSELVSTGSTKAGRRFVVVDENVDRCHGERIRRYLDHHDVEYRLCVICADESAKDFSTAAKIAEQLDAFGISRRNEPIIVIGGGVLMDIVGLVGSLYRRGTPFVRVPTTLIGLVDAGVGAKTGVNFNGHKNRLGTYFPADLTLLDVSFLSTLERRHISNGLAEVLKIALIKDRQLFESLEDHGRVLLDEKLQGASSAGRHAAGLVLRRAIHGMLEELQPNLWEAKLERCVDYGHTFSPTIEMNALPELLHGEAVCLDMAITTVLAHRRGSVNDEERERIFSVMRSLELPRWNPILQPNLLFKALEDTIRHRDGLQRLPLPIGIGDVVFVNDVAHEEIANAVDDLRRLHDEYT
ncbi:sedoheptulose 7-phosphate cyclase [Pendulispora brunnea]|uniref:Sedoheptulose 7-phosphate cyclase n=1 Tax=Pendulispora brunnea TaxID=2905690 RepID=A0ABZ2KD03_9BACT